MRNDPVSFRPSDKIKRFFRLVGNKSKVINNALEIYIEKSDQQESGESIARRKEKIQATFNQIFRALDLWKRNEIDEEKIRGEIEKGIHFLQKRILFFL